MKKESRAISTFLAIILILAFTIIGAFVSYMWVMAGYYNMPENTTLLVVEDIVFPTNNFTYFNVTVLNPSNSALDVNITAFILSVETKNETFVIGIAEPELPFLIKKATRQSFRCLNDWSNFAGETVRIEPIAEDASTKSYPYFTPSAKLSIYGFDASEKIEYFNVTVQNSPQSAINLTISEIMISDFSVNATPPLNRTLAPGGNETFRCHFNWGTMIGQNATITVKTAEGFHQTYEAGKIPGAFVYINEVKFDYADTTYFNVTVTSLADSTATAILDSVNLTLPDKTTIKLDTIPPLNIVPIPVPANQSLTLKCLWDWNTHRDETITVNVYTRQGFNVPGRTTVTPSVVVWNVDDVKFDLDDLEHFSVNVTNKPVSLYGINVTKVELNQNLTTINSTSISIGGQVTLICSFNWSSFVGEDATITVHAVYGVNESLASYRLTLPYMKIVNTTFSNSELGNPYVNVTVYHSKFSRFNATITQVFVKTSNGTFTVDGTITNPRISPSGYRLSSGMQVTMVCPWDWSPYLGKDVTVTAQTAEGVQVSITLKIG